MKTLHGSLCQEVRVFRNQELCPIVGAGPGSHVSSSPCPMSSQLQAPLAPYLQHLRISPDGNPAFTDGNSNKSDSATRAASWI